MPTLQQKRLLLNGNYSSLLFDNLVASAIYSLRKLRTAYNGAAIRVRRSSDNTEQDIGFVNGVLDIASLITFCLGSNGFVVVWYDQSDNGRNAFLTTAVNQPKIYDSTTGVVLENTKPAIQFNGLAELGTAQFTANFDIFSGFSVQNAGDTAVFFEVAWGIEYGISTVNYYLRRNDTTNNAQNVILSPSLGVNSTGGEFNRQYLNSVFVDRTVATLSPYSNSNLIDAPTAASQLIGTQSTYRILIGGANVDMTGTFQELILFTNNQLVNRALIENDINGFYTIF